MSDAELVRTAERLLDTRRLRDEVFADYVEGFGEPAFDMLLELFVGGEAGRPQDVTIAAAGCAPTTALLWLRWLESRGLVAIGDNGVAVSERGAGLMRRYLTQLQTA